MAHSLRSVYNFELFFSYGQFMVYDHSVSLPGCIWQDLHVNQGFARRESVVCFGTILDYGRANVHVWLQPFAKRKEHQRAISVPFFSPEGRVFLEGPEETVTDRYLDIEVGHYLVTAAQYVLNYQEEEIDLFFERVISPAAHSRILLADEQLNPPEELVEDAEIAEV